MGWRLVTYTREFRGDELLEWIKMHGGYKVIEEARDETNAITGVVIASAAGIIVVSKDVNWKVEVYSDTMQNLYSLLLVLTKHTGELYNTYIEEPAYADCECRCG